MSTVGERVAEARKRLGIGQAQLAKRAGISQSVVSSIEKGEITMSARTLASLSEALEVTADSLLGGARLAAVNTRLSAEAIDLIHEDPVAAGMRMIAIAKAMRRTSGGK